jgi:hypothetical protein
MNPFQTIPESEIQFFKEKVQRWIHIDNQIAGLSAQIRELKKVKNKELEPEITKFMTNYNVRDLNIGQGTLRCQELKTKQSLNKKNIRENLSKYLTEEDKLDQAIQTIWNEREVVVKHKLKKIGKK